MTFLRNMVDGIKYNIDYSLYLITDRNLLGNRNIENIVEILGWFKLNFVEYIL